MKELPIAFSGPMVRALLAGTKTQTRRIVQPQPLGEGYKLGVCISSTDRSTEGKFRWMKAEMFSDIENDPRYFTRPYGNPGDRLWVREDHMVIGHGSVGPSLAIKYCADGAVKHCNVTPREYALFRARKSAPGSVVRGRFTYRSIARIVLEVVSVRAERLNAISEEDAKAEGVTPTPQNHTAAAVAYIFGAKDFLAHTSAYATLWESINGPGSWEANPWVFAITFKRIEP